LLEAERCARTYRWWVVEVGRASVGATGFSGVDVVVFDVVAMVAEWTVAEVYSRACGLPGVGGRFTGECD
jgi:hypothetical protein